MILDSGMKVLVSHRRLFESDHARFFVGLVEAYESGVARITGNTWTLDGYRGNFAGKEDLRTKIVAIASGTLIVYQLPSTVDLGSFVIERVENAIHARDALGFDMDLSEGHLQAAPVSPTARRA